MPANPAGYAQTVSTRGCPLTPKRKRQHQIALRLNDQELRHLNRQSNLSGLSREAYIRSLIMGAKLHPRRANSTGVAGQESVDRMTALAAEVYRIVKETW